MEKILKLLLVIVVGCSMYSCGDNPEPKEVVADEVKALTIIKAYTPYPDYVLPELERDFDKYNLTIVGENLRIDTLLGKIPDGIMLPVGDYSFELKYVYKRDILETDSSEWFNHVPAHCHVEYVGRHRENFKFHTVHEGETNVFELGVTLIPDVIDNYCIKPIDKCYEEFL